MGRQAGHQEWEALPSHGLVRGDVAGFGRPATIGALPCLIFMAFFLSDVVN